MKTKFSEMEVRNLVDEIGFWAVLNMLRDIAEERVKDYDQPMVSRAVLSWLMAYQGAVRGITQILDNACQAAKL